MDNNKKQKSKCCNAPMYAKQFATSEKFPLIIYCSDCRILLDFNRDSTGITLETIDWPGVFERYKKIDRQRSDQRQSRYMPYCDYINNRYRGNPDPYKSYEYNGIPILEIFKPSHYKMIKQNERDQIKTSYTINLISNIDRASL